MLRVFFGLVRNITKLSTLTLQSENEAACSCVVTVVTASQNSKFHLFDEDTETSRTGKQGTHSHLTFHNPPADPSLLWFHGAVGL